MKKLFLLLVLFTTFYVANAQYQIDLTFDTPARTSGSNLCLKNTTGVSQKIFVNIYKYSNDTEGWGDIFLVYKNTNGVKNSILIGSVLPNLYSSGQVYTTSFNITISAANSPGGLDGQLYVQLLYAPNNINLQSSTYINYKTNNLAVPASSATFCPGQTTASLSASGCASYSWTPSTGLNTSNGSTVQASPSANTTYTVTGTASNGCTNTKTIAVTKQNDLNVAPTSTTTCPNQATTLTASGSSTYSWTPSTGLNTTTGATVISTPVSSLTYTVTGTKNGCSMQKTVTVNTLSPCGSTFANAINLGSFTTCPMWYTAVYNNSTANNYGNDYGTGNSYGQTSDDIYFKFYYDSNAGEQTMVSITTYSDDTNFDTYIHLLDANGNWLQSNDNAQDNPSRTYSTIVRSIYENYYYIVVEGKGAASGNFALQINAGSDCARIGTESTLTTDNLFSISPNPATDQLNISLPSSDVEAEITIYTMEGGKAKNVFTQTQANTIPVADLTPGFYLVKIKQGEFVKTEKIIIQ